jgi:PKD repeat protein
VFNDLVPQATSLKWDFGDGQSSTQTNPSHVYTSTGKYTVSLIASNGTVTDTITQNQLITVIGNTGILDLGKSNNNLLFYPNPVTNTAILKLNDHASHTLKVYNILGQLELATTFANEIQLDFTSLNAGVYFISLDNGTQVKLVKK